MFGFFPYLFAYSPNEWGNRVVGCRREVVNVEELKKNKKNREKAGVPGQVERGI